MEPVWHHLSYRSSAFGMLLGSLFRSVSVCGEIKLWHQRDQCPLSDSSSLQERMKSLNLSLKEITTKVSALICPFSKKVSEVFFYLNFMSRSQNTGSGRNIGFAKPFCRPRDELREPGVRTAPMVGVLTCGARGMDWFDFGFRRSCQVSEWKMPLCIVKCLCCKRLSWWK